MSAQRLATGASTGAIALRNSAQKSVGFSASLSETAPRVRSLHRDILRSVPWIKRAFGVQMTDAVNGPAFHFFPPPFFLRASGTNVGLLPMRSQKMRSLVTFAFKEKQDATDVTTINRLIIQGRMELEETLMLWKGPSHVRSVLSNPPHLCTPVPLAAPLLRSHARHVLFFFTPSR